MNWLKNPLLLLVAGVIAVVSLVQTGKDSYDNEPDPDQDKGQQVIGDLVGNIVDNVVVGAERGAEALFEQGDRLVEKYGDGVSDTFKISTYGDAGSSNSDNNMTYLDHCVKYPKEHVLDPKCFENE